VLVGLAILVLIVVFLGVCITAIVLAATSFSKAESVEDQVGDENCYSIRGVPGEDLVSSLQGHICFQCDSEAIEAVIDYEFQQASMAESFDLINTVLSTASIANGYESVALCGNETAPLCPAYKPTCTGSCKWNGRLSLTGDNKVSIGKQKCRTLRDNPTMYTLFTGTDVAPIAAVASLK